MPALACIGIEHLAMFVGDSEHVTDDRDRQAERKILDQVHLAFRNDPVERLIDDLLDPRTHVLDPPRGESFHHQPAQPGVVRRILLQHPVAHAAKDRLFHDLRPIAPRCPIDEILAEALVAQNETGLRVPAGDESTKGRDVHRIGSAQPLVGRIGIANEFRCKRVEKRLGCRGLNMLVHGRPRCGQVHFQAD